MRGLCVFALLVACGGKPNTPSTPIPEPDPNPEVKGGGLSTEVVSAVQGIPMLVRVKGLFLFDDEQLDAEKIVAAWAGKTGLSTVPPQQTHDILKRALLGQNATTGKACGAPLFEFQALQRWATELAARGKIEVGVYCSPQCAIQVSVSIGTGGEGGSEFFAAPFDPTKPWKSELAARLPTIVDNGGHNQHGHLNNPVAIEGVARSGGSDMILDDDKNAALTPTEIAAGQKCLATSHYASLLLGYDANGKLAHCEGSQDRLGGSVECVCKAIAARSGKPNTRERVEVSTGGDTEVFSKDKLSVRAVASTSMIPDPSTDRYKPFTTDPAIEMWEPPDREELNPCFAGADSQPKLEGRASIEFDAEGKATKAIITATTGTFTPEQQSCLRDAFLKVRAPCPSTPNASATAEIHVFFDKPDKP